MTRKLTHDEKVKVFAGSICKLCGIEPIDSMDGGANWFMFAQHAEKLITDLESRNFEILGWVKVKEEADAV